MTRSSDIRHYLMLGLLAVFWSSGFMFIKIGVETVPPLTMAAGRVVIAAVVLYAVMRAQGHRLPASGRLWAIAFVIGFFGNALPFFLISWGEVRVDSALAAILMAVMPLATLLLSHVFTADERLNVFKGAGVALGIGGVVILVGPSALTGLGGELWHQLAIAGGAVCYAIATVTARKLPPIPPLVPSAATMLCATVQVVPLALALDTPWALAPTAASLLSVAYLGLVPTALATIIYFQLVAARGATFLALNNFLIPVLGTVWGALFLGEVIGVAALFALAVILAGIAVATWRRPALRPAG